MSSKIVTFRLLDKKVDQNSHFVNEDGTIDKDKKIDFTHTYGVLNPYFILKDGVREVRQFIRGCSFFDPVKQKLEGFIPDINNSVVEFKAGGDIILDVEDDKVFIQWMKDHPLNTKSKFHNPEKHDKIFFTYDPKEVQELEVKKASKEDEAMEIVISLKSDPARLRAIGNLFEETAGLLDDSDIYLGLRNLAKENPENFTSSIASRQKSVLGDVKLAQKYGVILRDVKGFSYEGTGASILQPETKNGREWDNELVSFLMSKDGQDHYKQILIKIQQKEIEINAPAGELA